MAIFSSYIGLFAKPSAPRVLLLHGLEGSIRSHYAQGLLNEAAKRGWGADLLIFRSCGSELNRTRRFLPLGRNYRHRIRPREGIAGVSARAARNGRSIAGRECPAQVSGGAGQAICQRLYRGAATISVPFDLAGRPEGSIVVSPGCTSDSFSARCGGRRKRRQSGFRISRRPQDRCAQDAGGFRQSDHRASPRIRGRTGLLRPIELASIAEPY